MHIRVGTRGSRLAVWQAEYVQQLLSGGAITSELVFIDTKGDQVLDRSLSKIGSKGVFTQPYSFKTKTGRVVFDHDYFATHSAQNILDACPQKILSLNDKGLPVLNIPEAEAERGKCTECLACEVAGWDNGGGVVVDLPLPTGVPPAV